MVLLDDSDASLRLRVLLPKPKMTPEELKAFRVELMAKARAAKKAKKGKYYLSEYIMVF